MTFEPPASADPDALATSVMVVPWHDPVVDAVGYDVRSLYVELFWLNVLGPANIKLGPPATATQRDDKEDRRNRHQAQSGRA